MQALRDQQPERRLSDQHFRMLTEGSAISTEVIAERGYWTAERQSDLNGLGFSDYQRRMAMLPALVIPQFEPSGEKIHSVLRPDRPRNRKGKTIKYEQPHMLACA